MSRNQPPIMGLLALLSIAEAMRRGAGEPLANEAHGPHGPGCHCPPDEASQRISRDAFKIVNNPASGDQALLMRHLNKVTGQPIIRMAFIDPDDAGAEVFLEAKYDSIMERDLDFDRADYNFVGAALMAANPGAAHF